jgi:YD repeat-containing protein
VYMCTGDVYVDQTDASVPGLGGGLRLSRRWNSVWPANEIATSVGLFGPNWKSTYEESVFMGGDNFLKYSRGDGGYWSFATNPISLSGGSDANAIPIGGSPANTPLIVASPANASATIVQTATNWVIYFKDGEQRQFSLTTGQLTAIIDRNGNTTQLSYDSSNRLVTVADPGGRHLYFNYTGSGLLVTSVTSDIGLTLSYTYDAQGRLSQVTRPDLTTLNFAYNAQSQITSVTDANGKVLESHTYDSMGHGLTASQANGVNAVTLAYPQ